MDTSSEMLLKTYILSIPVDLSGEMDITFLLQLSKDILYAAALNENRIHPKIILRLCVRECIINIAFVFSQ